MAIKRKTTTQTKVFRREGPQAVRYDLSRPDCVTISIPVGSTWTSERHWHETHTEYLQILQGRAFVRLGHRSREYDSQHGVIEVPKFMVHEWHRVWREEDQEDLIVREWTVPEDGKKEVFFRMLNSFLAEDHPGSIYEAPEMVPQRVSGWLEQWIVMLQLFAIFRSCDNWPVVVGDDSGLFSRSATHLVLAICAGIGYMLGLRGTYQEYVEEALILRGGEGKTVKTKSE